MNDYAADLVSRKELNNVLKVSGDYYNEIMRRDTEEVGCT